MKKIILWPLFFILTNCSQTPTIPHPQLKNAQKARSCICTKLWMPVCGQNKKTYGNACEADCAGQKYTGGACAETK